METQTFPRRLKAIALAGVLVAVWQIPAKAADVVPKFKPDANDCTSLATEITYTAPGSGTIIINVPEPTKCVLTIVGASDPNGEVPVMFNNDGYPIKVTVATDRTSYSAPYLFRTKDQCYEYQFKLEKVEAGASNTTSSPNYIRDYVCSR